MRLLRHRRLPGRAAVIAAALSITVSGIASPVVGASASTPGPVSTTAASGTPYLALTKTVQTVRQLVKCGSTMFAVGRFWKILQNGQTYSRNNVFSFSAAAPYKVTGWSPNVDGEVDSIAFTSGHGCGTAYLGGDFHHVNGKAATNIAAVSTTSNAVDPQFGRYANGQVNTMVGYKDHLLVGGAFTRTNGYSRYYYESLSPSTGKVDGFINLHLQGKVPFAPRKIYNQQFNHTGSLLLVEGNFTSVAGQPRQQIFMLNLSGSTAKVTGWTSSDFSKQCASKDAFYVRAAAWSPDDSTVYVADTGVHPANWTKGSFPLWGLCDAVASFPSSQKSVSRNWVEYSGCDSYFSVAADDGAVYAGGHQRWANNPDACNAAGPGAVSDNGLQGLKPGSGIVETSGGNPMYSMSRANADDMLLNSAGLWIASTNRFDSNVCEGAANHSGICLLPYS